MKKLTNKRGISLIVLVITIIVMIILASAIILSLSSAGIIGKSNESKFKSDVANLREHAQLLYASDYPNITADTYAELELGSYADYLVLDEATGTLHISKDVDADSDEYEWLTEVGLSAAPEMTWEEAYQIDGTAAKTLQVGDYITYDSGVEGMTTTWRVFYNDKDRGVQIIPDKFDSKKLDYQGLNAISTIVEDLNQKTQSYLNTKYAKSVRALGTDPINPSVDTSEIIEDDGCPLDFIFRETYDFSATDLARLNESFTDYLDSFNQDGSERWYCFGIPIRKTSISDSGSVSRVPTLVFGRL